MSSFNKRGGFAQGFAILAILVTQYPTCQFIRFSVRSFGIIFNLFSIVYIIAVLWALFNHIRIMSGTHDIDEAKKAANLIGIMILVSTPVNVFGVWKDVTSPEMSENLIAFLIPVGILFSAAIFFFIEVFFCPVGNPDHPQEIMSIVNSDNETERNSVQNSLNKLRRIIAVALIAAGSAIFIFFVLLSFFKSNG